MAAEDSRGGGRDGAEEERDCRAGRQLASSSRIAQMPTKLQPDENGERAGERDGEHRPQGRLDVVAPDQAEETRRKPHRRMVRTGRFRRLA